MATRSPAGSPRDAGGTAGVSADTPVRRARAGRWWLGICAGLARRFAKPTWLVRLIWGISVVVTLGLSAVAYLVLAMVLPAEGAGDAGNAADAGEPS